MVKKKTGDGFSHLGKDRMDDFFQSWIRNLDVNIGHCAIVYLLGSPYWGLNSIALLCGIHYPNDRGRFARRRVSGLRF